MDDLNDIEKIIQVCIGSNIMKKPIPLWLIAPSGNGKSTMLDRFSDIPRVRLISGHITPNQMRTNVIHQIVNNRIHTLILDDIARFENRYRQTLFELIQQIVDGKVTVMQQDTQSETSLCCGVIISCVDTFFSQSAFQRMCADLGIDNRFLKVMYKYSEATHDEIGRCILNGQKPPEKILNFEVSERKELNEDQKQSITNHTLEPRQRNLLGNFMRLNSEIDILRYTKFPMKEV